MTKIAFATDDGRLISQHFGRARSFAVVTIEGGRETSREIRPKANHSMFIAAEGVSHGREMPPADGPRRHELMLGACSDCEAIIVGGIGQGAQANLAAAGITVIATHPRSIDEAVADWLAGRLAHRPELVHVPSGMGPGRHGPG